MSNCFQEIQEEEAVGWYTKYSDVMKATENAKESERVANLKR